MHARTDRGGGALVRFGVLGAGNIAHRFARSLAHVEGAELVAASRRSRAGARQFLDEVPAASGARAYGSHAELLEDGEVDAIYLALPHEFHREWATRAIEAGKAVLCEKPAMLTAADMARVADLARERGVLFMEAMKPRFVPLYPLIVQALPSLGAIRLVEASLCNDMLSSVMEAGTYHVTPGPGAGVLLDCGTYCAAWIEDLCPGVPRLTSVDGRQVRDVDVHVDACMDYWTTEASRCVWNAPSIGPSLACCGWSAPRGACWWRSSIGPSMPSCGWRASPRGPLVHPMRSMTSMTRSPILWDWQRWAPSSPPSCPLGTPFTPPSYWTWCARALRPVDAELAELYGATRRA